VFLNVGGIANLTYVTERFEDVLAFDTGPGNALIDEIVRTSTGRADAIDEDGRLAMGGTADSRAVDAFLAHPYFAAAPPKSTGKETFGREAAVRLAELVHPGSDVGALDNDALADLLATAVSVTARSVQGAFAFLPRDLAPTRVVVSGGGLRNRAFMTELARLIAPCPVLALDDPAMEPGLRMDPDAKEAVAFAVLADRAVAGLRRACRPRRGRQAWERPGGDRGLGTRGPGQDQLRDVAGDRDARRPSYLSCSRSRRSDRQRHHPTGDTWNSGGR